MRLEAIKKVKNTVNALENTETIFTISAILVDAPKAKVAKKAPIIWNRGAPGGCPTWSLAEVEMYSPASQKLPVGSTVRLKQISAIPKANHALYFSNVPKFPIICHELKDHWRKYQKIVFGNYKNSLNLQPHYGAGLWCNW
jgi:hypothetical protein